MAETGPLGVASPAVEIAIIVGLVLLVVGVPILLWLRQQADRRKREG